MLKTTTNGWVGRAIYWEFCKKIKFDYTTKWSMYLQELIREIETYKIFKGFEIYKCPNPSQKKKELATKEIKRNWKDKQIVGSCQRTKKIAVEHDGDSDSTSSWCVWKWFRGRIETIQTTALSSLDRILRRVLYWNRKKWYNNNDKTKPRDNQQKIEAAN